MKLARRRTGAAGAVVALLLGTCSFAAIAQQSAIDAWYAALAVPDRDRLDALLAPDARIRLTDLGVEQSKAEFIAALDEWETAVAGATIRHRVEAADGETTTVLACYDFPANDVLMRELFRIRNGRIVENGQAVLAEDCGGY
ncbi:nuclear transport factor 2 family protein [Kumtagia ephedrae]|uniref:SnoaL-like domain-containing protein n=1 Tax=Kumtagia ephedrae TaxID=2116701 RepID=A0A2P7S8A8_9HYPH|nr:nuclear transport factor 2 family protein [Mesorhizobium ephedrae]PSJ58728.1 hypothetical protein C7I84_14695 [Mesorhizobium ephedrae]